MKRADDFANELKQKLGNNLVSVTLYGSTVSGDTTKKFSDVDLFVLLHDAGLSALKPALPAIRTWMKAGNKPPLVFSTAQLEHATDVFSVEFSDIKDQHRVLVGGDPFTNISIDRVALRQQLEYELRVNSVRLRRHYFESGETPRALAGILAQSLSTFSALFRTVLRLLGEPAPAVRKDAWRALARHVAVDVAVLEKIWDLRADGLELDPAAADELYEKLTTTVELVIDFVDALK